MPIMLNPILRGANLRLKDVRLIRHKDNRAKRGFTPYELWRDNRAQFELYQSIQSFSNRTKMNAPYWAVFVVNQAEETLFAGIYSVRYAGLLQKATQMPHTGEIDEPGSCDVYNLQPLELLNDLIGRLVIDWGRGALAWVQYPERNNKPVVELRRAFREPDFPGFMNFIQPLSKLAKMPQGWVTALQSSRGVYLLTCPKTKEQYVGSATGGDGFWGRWQNYIDNGHGGNVALKSRDPSDYQISILEVAGTAATSEDILAMEGKWQLKLQSQEMGLNRNLAKRQE